ncbi:MAG: ABC transporter permease [Pirellulaceae bacterium]|jgi:putative ABC transport system permease protein|nr:ABC transporter permease [Pirellulaceae bacterium]
MNFFSGIIWRLGIKSLALHPMRSLLTILGIFIGIASVVWLLAIGEGISLQIQKQIEALGTNNVIVRSEKPIEENSLDTSSMAIYGITRDDYAALMKTIPTITAGLRIRDVERELHYKDKDLAIHLVGCTSEYAEVMKLSIAEGRFFIEQDIRSANNYCVLSYELSKYLFPLESALGKQIRVRDIPYEVIGTLQKRESTSAIGSSMAAQDFSDDVYIPIETFWRRIGDWTMIRSAGERRNEIVQISQITFQIDQIDNVINTADAIKGIMQTRHAKDDYVIITPLELLEQAKTTRLMFMMFMGLIAAISLMVGGIGIMNIMLATVTERTREIGIRRALGAKKRDIIVQFLVETVVLSAVGGLTGILGGLLCPTIVTIIRDFAIQSFPNLILDLPQTVRETSPIIVPASIPLAFTISIAVGISFGIYPAIRAASLDPIEALRHE